MKLRLLKSTITLAVVALAVFAAVALYSRYIENPWTRDGQVRANIVGIASRLRTDHPRRGAGQSGGEKG